MSKTIILVFNLLAFQVLFVSNAPAFASNGKEAELRNPFLLLEEQKKGFDVVAEPTEEAEAKIQERLAEIHVSGIFISGSTKIAIINGEIVEEGGSLGDIKVISIMPEKVVVDIKGGAGSLALPSIAENSIGE